MNVQKLLFIIPALPDYVPYVYNYFKIAEGMGKEYDVVCWNRRGMEADVPANYIVYNHLTKDGYPILKKLREIYGFSRFVRKSIRGRKYDAVFTYTIADSLFFGFWLPHCYKGRYVFDIRDYSPLISNRFTGWIIKRLLGASAMNVISSDGFRKWLPKGFNYTVCHNTDLEKVRESIHNNEIRQQDGTIRLLTIGNLRNADVNQSVIDALANREGIELRFAGGGVSDKLQLHCKENNIKNVHFSGCYRKEDEDSLVQQCDMMNIMLPHDAVSDHLMSNRFYLSVRFRKPMIVNDGCFQAEVVRKYGLGLVANSDDSLYDNIMSYWKNIDWEDYNHKCAFYLEEVCKELDIFKKGVEKQMINSMVWGGNWLIIITIGMIRDFDSNVAIIDAFANRDGVQLQFAGLGSEKLQRYSETKKINNINFSGRYLKDEEDDIVKQADMINLFLPHTLNSDTCMGNRIYLAARLRKPIIVTDNSWQAVVVKKYNLGICVEWNEDLELIITDYWTHLDWKVFDDGCQEYLKQVENDMEIWESKVRNTMKS